MIAKPRVRATGPVTYPRRKTTKRHQFNCTFVGSFYKIEQLPNDPRPCVAFAGRSNVGKSSLLNVLVGQKNMAKVSSTPGKTRSLNFFLVNDKFYLVDLPGYGYAQVSKSIKSTWGEMIETFLTKAEHLAGLALLIDSRRDPTPEDMQMLEWLAARKTHCLAVVTKADKVNNDQVRRKVKQVETQLGVSSMPFSAHTGAGRNELAAAIVALVTEYSQR
jgi:GTP-binding protein